MNKSIKKLIAENNDKRELLSENNKAYYENFLMYVRAALLKNERATEEVLMEMLDHLLLAQEEGKSAEAVFGKEPKQLADDVIENLPQEPFKYLFTFVLELILTVFAFYTIVRGIFYIVMKESKVVFLGNVLVIGSLLVLSLGILVYVCLRTLQREAFDARNKKFMFPVVLVILMASVAVALLSVYLPNIGSELDLGVYGVFSVSCLLMLITFIMKKIREQR